MLSTLSCRLLPQRTTIATTTKIRCFAYVNLNMLFYACYFVITYHVDDILEYSAQLLTMHIVENYSNNNDIIINSIFE